jgi:hypothetical protein
MEPSKMRGQRMAKMRAVGTDRQNTEAQAQQVPLSWRVAKPATTPLVIQSASSSTVTADPIAEVTDYYRDRAASFRKRRKLARDDDAADERLF